VANPNPFSELVEQGINGNDLLINNAEAFKAGGWLYIDHRG